MNLLGLFAKWPRSGQVKTRLAAAIGSDLAAQAAAAFLSDSLDRLATIADRRIVAFAPPDAEHSFRLMAPPAWELWPQTDGDLGDRLEHFFQIAFESGAHRVVVVGADSPTLPVAYVRDSFAQLHSHDVVIGPSADGGYYLLGLVRPLTGLFRGVSWSGANVLHQTIARVGTHKLALLPVWYDIDTPDDWSLLRGHVAAYRKAGQPIDFPRTAELAEKS